MELRSLRWAAQGASITSPSRSIVVDINERES